LEYFHPVSPAINKKFGRFKDRPNVILITLDTTRADHLSCYGYSRNTSPNLDKFAGENLLFTYAYSTSTWTLPGHASIFTGMYVSRHGARLHEEGRIRFGSNRICPLQGSAVTLAEILQERGYTTLGVTAGPMLNKVFGLHQGFHFYDDLAAIRRADEVNEVVFRHLSVIKSPFFLFINYFDPHRSYAPPPPFDTLFSTPGKSKPALSEVAIVDQVLLHNRPLTAEEQEHFSSQYDGEIAYMDKHLGLFLDKIKALDFYGSSYIIITADHGECLGEHNLVGHDLSLHQPVLRVPLVVKYPRFAGPGAVDQRMVEIVDILLALLFDLGIEPPQEVQGVPFFGRKLMSFAEGCRNSDHVRAFGGRFDRSLQASIRDGKKLILSSSGDYEFYDLVSDPLENTNLIGSDRRSAEKLKRMMSQFHSSFEHAGAAGSHIEAPEEIGKKLKALGYIN